MRLHGHMGTDLCHAGLLQEGFGDYLDTALKATHRSRTNQRNIVGDGEVPADEDSRASLWFAAGAMAVGAMAAFTLKQAFS